MNSLTDYIDNPLTQALSQRFGKKLETLTAPDKLEVAQAILTAMAWGCHTGKIKTITETIAEFGSVMPGETSGADVIALIDAHSPDAEVSLGIAAALCHQLHKGVYAHA